MVQQAEGQPKRPAGITELISMMNKRPGVTARIAGGEELAYLQAVEAAASHV